MDNNDRIEALLEKTYWIIDILPKRVPEHGKGQYFKIEKFYLKQSQRIILCQKFANILIKMNCYDNIMVCYLEDFWSCNPSPENLVEWISESMSKRKPLFVLFESTETLITISGDDTYMTLYNPDTDFLDLIRSLAASEGMFVWKP